MKLAMFVGDGRHYRLDEIKGRHFIQTTERAGLPGALAREALEEVAQVADAAITTVERHLPGGFPNYIHDAVKAGLTRRLKDL
jgi:serine/threonine-protein kinase HipA